MEENDCSLHNGMAWHGFAWYGFYMFLPRISMTLLMKMNVNDRIVKIELKNFFYLFHYQFE